jgi:hypothetical protein
LTLGCCCVVLLVAALLLLGWQWAWRRTSLRPWCTCTVKVRRLSD